MDEEENQNIFINLLYEIIENEDEKWLINEILGSNDIEQLIEKIIGFTQTGENND